MQYVDDVQNATPIAPPVVTIKAPASVTLCATTVGFCRRQPTGASVSGSITLS